MTIKELENRTGMPRANIRFYEGEGLLTPKRLDNGYRDYSEEDAATLEKIKLLRQLQLDIDTIRKVQAGALTLEQALFTQLTRLEGDKAVIERAAAVCRELQQTCVEYAALEPQPWLYKLEAPQQSALPEAPPDAPENGNGNEWDGEPRACYFPWRRYFARALDMNLYSTLINVPWMVLLHDLSLWEFQRSLLGELVFGLALLVLTLAVEPLWLHFLGWTPGKWLFGLKLRDENGDKLTLAQGWERSWRVFQDGYGWNIPLWDLYKMWKCRKMGLDGRDCWWDAEEAYRYAKVERWFNSAVVYILLTSMLLGGRFAAQRWAALPRNRGELTVAEFCQNYNQFHDQFSEYGFSYIPKLDNEGHWIEDKENAAVSHGGFVSITSDGTTYTIENPVEDTTVWSQPEFTTENGRITAVTLHWESQDSIVSHERLRTQLALMAMSGASQEVTLFHFDAMEWYLALWEVPAFEDQELDYQGLHISQKADYEGYVYVGAALRAEDENAPCRFEKSVTISVPEA